MPTPGEQEEVAAEATRLLQEGLRLLDERSREVEAEAQRVRNKAEARARQIVATAERERAGLEEELMRLRAEVSAAHAQLASLRVHLPTEPDNIVPDVAPSTRPPEARAATPGAITSAEAAGDAQPSEGLAVSEIEPRWGRPPPAQPTHAPARRSRWRRVAIVLVVVAVAGLVILAYLASTRAGELGSLRDLAIFR